jgi:LDH2 family malate/lactate/ureidoglycolate dehydrogenase
MAVDVVYISVETLQRFMVDVFHGCGIAQAEAEICAEVLITSDVRGIESHGVGRLKMYYDGIKMGLHRPVTEIEIVKESPTTAVIDGHNGMGHVIGTRAMEMAIEKAKTYGMGSVAVRNSSHFGIAGYYALMAVKAGMIGMSFTNARPSVSPTFGVRPMLGTNPIAFGAPTDEACPFVYDAATSITQRGKIEVLEREEKAIPQGWVIDDNGQTTTDTKAALAGFPLDKNALLPLGGLGEMLGGHKGYGLGVMVEILSASLSHNAFMHNLPGGGGLPVKIGHFFTAINIESFCPLEDFKATTGAILRDLRRSTKAPGKERIYTAGEKEYETEKRVRLEGIAVNSNLQKDIKILQAELQLTQYEFPF